MRGIGRTYRRGTNWWSRYWQRKLLSEHNARQGFLEPATFRTVLQHLPEALQDLARFACLTGWRKGG